MPPKDKDIPLSDLLSAEASQMTQTELRRFRKALSLGLPELVGWAADLAKGSDQAGSTDQANTTGGKDA